MSSVIETLDGGIDPQQEVKKLQNLVKKLERQNEALRSRHNKTMSSLSSDTSKPDEENQENIQRTPSASPRIELKQTSTPVSSSTDNKRSDDSPEKMLIDDMDMVDVYNELDEKEDSWLYISPKQLLPSQSKVSPYKWLRQEFERSDTEVSTSRKSLVFKLEEVTSPKRSGNLTYRSYSSSPLQSNNNNSSNGGSPMLRQPLVSSAIQESYIDSGTFTRSKKKQRPALGGDFRGASLDNSREVSPEDGAQPAEDDYRLNNVLDIQALARAQEESLRQSYNSPVNSPRRISLRASTKSNSNANNSNNVPPLSLNDVDSSSPLSSNRSSPGRFDENMKHPELPHASSESKLSPGRRSLGGLRPNNSTGHLKSSLGRPTSPSVKSLGGPGSPRRSASPAGRSSIPRPGASAPRSGIPAPRRSAIPSPRTNRTRQGDDSWKEGCY